MIIARQFNDARPSPRPAIAMQRGNKSNRSVAIRYADTTRNLF
jgi:hypothetical protein